MAKDKGVVRDSRLTPEFKAFSKNVQRVHALQQMVRRGVVLKQTELERLMELSQQLSGQKQRLMQMQPDVVFDLPGQEKGRAKRLRHSIGD